MKASTTLVALVTVWGCGRSPTRLETQTFELRYLQTDQANIAFQHGGAHIQRSAKSARVRGFEQRVIQTRLGG